MPQDKFILVVDDEPGIQDFVKHNLELRSFKVEIATNGLEALSLFEQTNCILVILDVMLPRLDGLEVCRRIRQNSTVPIIVLTALGEETDKIAALNLGADDYLTKPFGVGELLARVRAVLRRSHWTENNVAVTLQRFGNLEIDFALHAVSLNGEFVKLTPIEFALLQELALHPGKVRTRETLLKRVWGPEYHNETEYLRVYIGRLRRKLEADPANPIHIMTEPGIGYFLMK
ncbi:MAG TPA: response regulator transcription factor [Ktedonobacteraceae bacterium]|nr:response regulator transcription factor [Ktedonobacteraceae bacterium]